MAVQGQDWTLRRSASMRVAPRTLQRPSQPAAQRTRPTALSATGCAWWLAAKDTPTGPLGGTATAGTALKSKCQPREKASLPHQALLYDKATLATRASRPLKDLRAYRAECTTRSEGLALRPQDLLQVGSRTTDINNKRWLHPERPRPPRRPEATGAAREAPGGAHDQGIPPGSRRKRESAGVPREPRSPGPKSSRGRAPDFASPRRPAQPTP